MKKFKKRISKIGDILGLVLISPLLIVALLISIIYLLIDELIEKVIIRKPKLTDWEEFILWQKENREHINEAIKRGEARSGKYID